MKFLIPQGLGEICGLAFSQGMLPGCPGIQIKSHLDGRGRATQAHGRGKEYKSSGRRSFQSTKVGKELQLSLKDELVKSLKKSLDVFAWSHEDMPGIDEQVIEHSLNVDVMKKPV